MVLIICAILLIVNAIFNVVVWPRFLTRVKNDARAFDAEGNPTKFLRVHQVLIGIALVLAALSAVLGVIGLVTAAS